MFLMVICLTGSDRIWRTSNPFRSCLNLISDVAKAGSLHWSDLSSARIDSVRSGAVSPSLVSYQGNWKQFNQMLDEETVFVSLL